MSKSKFLRIALLIFIIWAMLIPIGLMFLVWSIFELLAWLPLPRSVHHWLGVCHKARGGYGCMAAGSGAECGP